MAHHDDLREQEPKFKVGDNAMVIAEREYLYDNIAYNGKATVGDVGKVIEVSVEDGQHTCNIMYKLDIDNGDGGTYIGEEFLVPWIEIDVPEESPLDTQVGGDHYQKAIQPIEYIHANQLPFIEGNVVKYITRWREKNGLEDLEKIKQYIDILIRLEKLND